MSIYSIYMIIGGMPALVLGFTVGLVGHSVLSGALVIGVVSLTINLCITAYADHREVG